MKSIEKLAKRIKDDLNIEVDVISFHRTYADWMQRDDGTWSWWFDVKGTGGLQTIGSQWNVKEVLAFKKLAIVDKYTSGQKSIVEDLPCDSKLSSVKEKVGE